MTEIEKLIEEEAGNLQYGMQVESFKKGADFILHHNRWRKVSEELPEMGQLIAVKYKMAQYYDDKYTVYEIDSSRMFELLKEYGDEWKPII